MEIKLEHVSKYYDRKILDDLSLELKDIHALGIIGESGCGKSTLLRLLAGMEKPEKGSVWVNGTLLQGKAVKEYQKEIGYVFQKHNLFPHLSVKENIVLILNKIKKMPRPEAEQKAETMLKKVRLEAEMDKKPDAVSGGQAQRASIARALATDPQMIFLDEPTAALGVRETGIVLDLIRQLKQRGTTVILISHSMEDVVAVADHVTVLHTGQCVATLAAAELTADSLAALIRAGRSGRAAATVASVACAG